ncbi:hypothetical protein [Streptomyces xiamenensis]|uniref:hypothetical protein n=1 Tax=Streptomyces xiamenensis TaxID=408015 RepID=UPI0035DAD01C
MTDEERQLGGEEIFLRAAGMVAILLFAALTFSIAPFGAMNSAGCHDGDSRSICSTGVQQAVALAPWITAPLAAVAGVAGMARREDGGAGWWFGAVLLLVVTWIFVMSMAG